jgi:hypothetical protein
MAHSDSSLYQYHIVNLAVLSAALMSTEVQISIHHLRVLRSQTFTLRTGTTDREQSGDPHIFPEIATEKTGNNIFNPVSHGFQCCLPARLLYLYLGACQGFIFRFPPLPGQVLQGYCRRYHLQNVFLPSQQLIIIIIWSSVHTRLLGIQAGLTIIIVVITNYYKKIIIFTYSVIMYHIYHI